MGARVLVVEDDVDIADALTDILADEGYEVQQAFDGLEALDVLERTRDLPDVILLDLMMPRLDGGGFRQRQLANPRFQQVPVIVVSADRLAREKAHAMLAADCLPKPLDPDCLLRVVARVAKNGA